MTATDHGLTLDPDNADLLKLKGDILRDMKNMLEAENVSILFTSQQISVLHSIIGRL